MAPSSASAWPSELHRQGVDHCPLLETRLQFVVRRGLVEQHPGSHVEVDVVASARRKLVDAIVPEVLAEVGGQHPVQPVVIGHQQRVLDVVELGRRIAAPTAVGSPR